MAPRFLTMRSALGANTFVPIFEGSICATTALTSDSPSTYAGGSSRTLNSPSSGSYGAITSEKIDGITSIIITTVTGITGYRRASLRKRRILEDCPAAGTFSTTVAHNFDRMSP